MPDSGTLPQPASASPCSAAAAARVAAPLGQVAAQLVQVVADGRRRLDHRQPQLRLGVLGHPVGREQPAGAGHQLAGVRVDQVELLLDADGGAHIRPVTGAA